MKDELGFLLRRNPRRWPANLVAPPGHQPGQLGIGTYSPRLDRFGNSVRGTDVCIDLASRLGLHVFDCVNVGSSFLDAIL